MTGSPSAPATCAACATCARRPGGDGAGPDHYDEDWGALWWVRVRGPARVLETGGGDEARALALLAAKYPQYRAAPPAGPVLRLELEEWRGWAAGGVPAPD